MRRHAGAVALVTLDVVLIGKGLLGVHGHVWHIVTRHMRVLWHARSAALRGDVLARLFWRVNLVAFDTVLVARCGLRGVEACLN